MDYREAGVDVVAGREFIQRIRSLVDSTRRPEILGDFGGFSGLCQIPTGYREPILVSGTDGVGTKLKIAQAMNQHQTIGIDLVAMCANDILTSGAEPLFFLDYLATGKLDPETLTQVVEGIAAGCRQAGCALLGGETAEMPGFYAPGDYDLAGFCVGVVERSEVLDGHQVQLGDRVLGLASSGIHSNGLSLVRRIIEQGDRSDRTRQRYSWTEVIPSLGKGSLGEIFLTPTRLYVQSILEARLAGLTIHGMAHITGGGLPENLPRCLGEGQTILLDPSSWPVPEMFNWLSQAGGVSWLEMYNTFNMGIGFAVLLPPEQLAQGMHWFQRHGLTAYAIGEVVEGNGEVSGLV